MKKKNNFKDTIELNKKNILKKILKRVQKRKYNIQRIDGLKEKTSWELYELK